MPCCTVTYGLRNIAVKRHPNRTIVHDIIHGHGLHARASQAGKGFICEKETTLPPARRTMMPMMTCAGAGEVARIRDNEEIHRRQNGRLCRSIIYCWNNEEIHWRRIKMPTVRIEMIPFHG